MLTYTGVTAAQFASLQSSLRRQGFTLKEDSGVIKKLGAVVGYSYSSEAQQLDVDVKHAPWTVKLSSFTKAVDEEIRKALQGSESGSAIGAAQIASAQSPAKEVR